MTVTITLPEKVEAKLKHKAQMERRSVEEVALDILSGALEPHETYPSPEDIVAKIQATPPNPQSIRPAQASLADALRDAPEDPDFDLATWRRAWAAVEAEIRAITLANDIAEGRG